MNLSTNGSAPWSSVASCVGGSRKVRSCLSRGVVSSLNPTNRSSSSFHSQENVVMRIWSQDRFDASGKITLGMAARALRREATQEMKESMVTQLDEDRQAVRLKMRDQVHELLRMGSEITNMTYKCPSSVGSRACVTPRTMRESYIQDGGEYNIKCIHWIFHQLPFGTHSDVLPQRKSHMDLSVEKVEREMGITWSPTMQGGKESERNCLQNCYSKMLNDKKQTIIKEEGSTHGRKPWVRHPRNAAVAGNVSHYKKGKTMYYWSSKTEGKRSVSWVGNGVCVW